jgi:hypothetical protein
MFAHGPLQVPPFTEVFLMAKQGAIDTEALRQKTAARAYQIWESTGRPHGYHQQHWAQAEAEILGKGKSSARRTAAASKTGSASKSTVTAPKTAAVAKAIASGESAPKATAKKNTGITGKKK